MPVTIQPATLKYKNGNSFQSADCLKGDKGDPGDPSLIIDDTAGSGDTDKTWSADKINSELDDKYEKPSTGIPASDLASGVIPSVPVQDVQINGSSILSSGVANVPVAANNTYGVVKVATAVSNVKAGESNSMAIVTNHQHEAVFYGLAKCAGENMASSSNAVGVYTPQAKAAIWNMLGLDGSAFVKSDWELIREDTFTNESADNISITVDDNGNAFELTDIRMVLWFPTQNNEAKITNGAIYLNEGLSNPMQMNVDSKTVTAGSAVQEAYAFIEQRDGMATVMTTIWSGDASLNNYKAKMKYDKTASSYPFYIGSEISFSTIGLKNVTGTMGIRVYGKRKRSALDSPVVNVSGTTPSITALPGHRYICGEVATLSITAPASGCIDVLFESGSTPTVLTLTSAKSGVSAIKLPSWFDPTDLASSCTYEINILDGEYGAVSVWA